MHGLLAPGSGVKSSATAEVASSAVPRMRYEVLIDDGPVLCVAMQPSGGFDADRLGVVAVPMACGSVRLVGLPKPTAVVGDGAEDGVRLTVATSLVLGGCDGSGRVSRLCWSKVSGRIYVSFLVYFVNWKVPDNKRFSCKIINN